MVVISSGASITYRVRFHLCEAVAERSPLGGPDFWVSVFSCCVFPLWRCSGGAEAGVRGRSAEWVLEPFFVTPCGAVAAWRRLASTLLKYRSRYIDIKKARSLCNLAGESAIVKFRLRLQSFKYQSPGFGISRNVRIRHFNSFLNSLD